MSLAAFAKLLDLASPSTAYQIEVSEAKGTISVHRLRAAPDALGCDLAVVLIPRQPLAQHVLERARKVAAARGPSSTSQSSRRVATPVPPHPYASPCSPNPRRKRFLSACG